MAAPARITNPIMATRRIFERGDLAGRSLDLCWGGSGRAAAGVWVFASFSTVNESMMTFSLGVNILHLACGMRQVGAGLVVSVQRDNLVVAGTCQRVLRLHDFYIVGDPGLEAVACLPDLF